MANGKVIFVKRADRDLGYLVRTDGSWKVLPEILEVVHPAKNDKTYRGQVSLESVKRYLDNKGISYVPQERYEKHILRLPNKQSIDGVMDFFREAEKVSKLNGKALTEDEYKSFEDWKRKYG